LNISFSATKKQFKAKKKHVTRRLGWLNLRPGRVLRGCEKCQGLKKGEHVVQMGNIKVIEVNQEPLFDIVARPVRPNIPHDILENYASVPVHEVELEGFPEFKNDGFAFIEMFCTINNCDRNTEVTRILFDYV
jgi:hypothetical protein